MDTGDPVPEAIPAGEDAPFNSEEAPLEAPVKIESSEEKVLREKKEARRLRLARSHPPVRKICIPVQHYGSTGTD